MNKTNQIVINKSELVLYEVVEAIEAQYEGSIPNHIKDMIRDLKVALALDIEILDDDCDYKDVELIHKVYYDD